MTSSINDILLNTNFTQKQQSDNIESLTETTQEKNQTLNYIPKEQEDFILDIFEQIKIYRNGYGMSLKNESDEITYLSELIVAIHNFKLKKNDLLSGIEYLKLPNTRYLLSPVEFCMICGLCKHNLLHIYNNYPAEKAHELSANLGFNSPLEKWPHLVIREAADKTGWFLLRNKNTNHSFPAFEKFYKESLTQAALGVKFNHTPPPALPDLTRTPFTPAQKIINKQGIADLRKILNENKH